MAYAVMLWSRVESSVSGKPVLVEVGAVNATTSRAYFVVPETAEYAVELLVLRRAMLIAPAPLVDVNVFSPIFIQSIEKPGLLVLVRKATPRLFI